MLDRLFSRLRLLNKALFELGPSQLGLYGLYRLGLRSGFFRRQTSLAEPLSEQGTNPYVLKPVITFPARQELMYILGEAGYHEILTQADEIVSGRVQLYGGEPQPLLLTPPEPVLHWTAYELGSSISADTDVKHVWEPARFGWAYTLGRAYRLSGDERYAGAFWQYCLRFISANPPYMGINWVSAQEVALRLIALVFAAQIFANSPHSSAEQMKQLGWSIACHARRIPPTLVYARAQNNNHLLSEAAGLLTAGFALPEHPDSVRWQSIGWQWFTQGVQSQIQQDGTYAQHSTNYHRLMLQLALWVAAIARTRDMALPLAIREKLQAATRWLIALCDPLHGKVPNLGPNDGAYILPLTVCPYEDYRPVLQAAAQVFLGAPAVPPGQWDEMSAWLARSTGAVDKPQEHALIDRSIDVEKPLVLRNQQSNSWAYLRSAHFTSRPGHADQLHLDLWWRGLNIAQDAGTYLYNAPKPWDNVLSRTAFHNTLTINDRDQMMLARRFLWLDWADSKSLAQDRGVGEGTGRLVAEHNGYRRFGITHRRSVTAHSNGDWLIEDRLVFSDPKRASRCLPLAVRLQWLVPDWPWKINQTEDRVVFGLESQYGWIQLMIQLEIEGQSRLQLVPSVFRAGEKLYGPEEVQPTWGWVSPSYGIKNPAVSFSVKTTTSEPIRLVSVWQFP